MEWRVFGSLHRNPRIKGRSGLDLRADAVALALVLRDAAGPRLERCELLPIDPQRGRAAVGEALRAAALPRLPISTVLRGADYRLALVEAPDVPPAELRAAMRWRLKEAIDFPVEEAVIDLFDVPAQTRITQGRMLYAVAARRTAVERHAAALATQSAFDVVDVPELCLRNLAAQLPDAAAGVALLHLGATQAQMVLIRGRTFYFARQIERKGGARTASESVSPPSWDTAGVVLELQRSLDYYERHFDQPPITRIAVAQSGAESAMLVEELRRDTGFEVAALDLNLLLPGSASLAPEVQADCLLAVGAALREERRSL